MLTYIPFSGARVFALSFSLCLSFNCSCSVHWYNCVPRLWIYVHSVQTMHVCWVCCMPSVKHATQFVLPMLPDMRPNTHVCFLLCIVHTTSSLCTRNFRIHFNHRHAHFHKQHSCCCNTFSKTKNERRAQRVDKKYTCRIGHALHAPQSSSSKCTDGWRFLSLAHFILFVCIASCVT